MKWNEIFFYHYTLDEVWNPFILFYLLLNASFFVIQEKESFLKKFKAIFAFELSGSDGKKGFWYVDAKKKGIVVRGKSDGKI